MRKLSDEEVNERKASGKLWVDTPKGFIASIKAKSKVDRFNHSYSFNLLERIRLPKKIFKSFGKSWIEPPIHVALGKNITIGDGCYFNFNTVLLDDYTISIGNQVMFAPNVTVCTTGHPLHIDLRQNGEMYCAPVVIEDGVWIGSSVTILPGVTIGKNSVIGAGSVVTKNIPENSLAMGIPCKVIRSIDEHDKEVYYKDYKYEYGKIE